MMAQEAREAKPYDSTFKCYGCRERCAFSMACSACGRCPDCHSAIGCKGNK